MQIEFFKLLHTFLKFRKIRNGIIADFLLVVMLETHHNTNPVISPHFIWYPCPRLRLTLLLKGIVAYNFLLLPFCTTPSIGLNDILLIHNVLGKLQS